MESRVDRVTVTADVWGEAPRDVGAPRWAVPPYSSGQPMVPHPGSTHHLNRRELLRIGGLSTMNVNFARLGSAQLRAR